MKYKYLYIWCWSDSAQSDQHLCCSLPRQCNTSSFYMRNFKPLPSFCSCTGRLESTLVIYPEDRFSRDGAEFNGNVKLFDKNVNKTDIQYEPRHEKTYLWESPTRQDTNRPAQLQRPARILKFRIYKLEVSFCLGSEQQRRWSDCADAQADLRLCCSHMT